MCEYVHSVQKFLHPPFIMGQTEHSDLVLLLNYERAVWYSQCDVLVPKMALKVRVSRTLKGVTNQSVVSPAG